MKMLIIPYSKVEEGGSVMKEIFKRIYQNNLWGGKQSVSGPGSDVEQTETIVTQIPILIHNFKIKTMLDAPCGDFNWMTHINLNVDYTGVDIVPELIEKNNKMYANPKRKFHYSDITRDPLAKVDLILCRDCLVHFSFQDIQLALHNFKRSGSKYLLTTTFTRIESNIDIVTGDWRPLNFERPPFNFTKPLFIINENCTENNLQYSDKSLALWEIESIPPF